MSKPAAKHYDFAIIGAGGAGLSMFHHLRANGLLEDRTCLIVDPQPKNKHDRTWSFWERGEGPFEAVVRHAWSSVGMHNDHHSASYELDPLRYKMIVSTDFYRFCHDQIAATPTATTLAAKASSPQPLGGGQMISFSAGGQDYTADFVFSSVPHPLNHEDIEQPYLDQHFRGWFFRCENECFDPDHATIMDFRTEQRGETRFFYVLPLSPSEALVEIAIFSNHHLTTATYDELIGRYLHDHWPSTGHYEVYHTEQGVIPMTTYPFPHVDGRIVHLGLGGGQARPSTGFTFYNIQQRCAALARCLRDNGRLDARSAWPLRHVLYDATLLDILTRNTTPGAEFFPRLFATNPTHRVFNFLNGKTTLLDELQLMSTTDIPAFGRAFVRQVVRSI